jgi:hypothetical protein
MSGRWPGGCSVCHISSFALSLVTESVQAHTEVPQNLLPGTGHWGHSERPEEHPLEYGREMKAASNESIYCTFFAVALVALVFSAFGSEPFSAFCSSSMACILA